MDLTATVRERRRLRTLSPKTKRNVLLAVTGLVVAYVRRVVQYGYYSWESIGQFLTWWLIHYFAIVIVVMITFACIKGTEKFFFGYEDIDRGLTVEEALVYISLVILVSAAFIFFLALIPPWQP